MKRILFRPGAAEASLARINFIVRLRTVHSYVCRRGKSIHCWCSAPEAVMVARALDHDHTSAGTGCNVEPAVSATELVG